MRKRKYPTYPINSVKFLEAFNEYERMEGKFLADQQSFVDMIESVAKPHGLHVVWMDDPSDGSVYFKLEKKPARKAKKK